MKRRTYSRDMRIWKRAAAMGKILYEKKEIILAVIVGIFLRLTKR